MGERDNLMYFAIQPMKKWDVDPFEFYDKMLLKKDYESQGVRAVPHAVAMIWFFLGRNVILMPSYVNIGAYGARYYGGHLGYCG